LKKWVWKRKKKRNPLAPLKKGGMEEERRNPLAPFEKGGMEEEEEKNPS